MFPTVNHAFKLFVLNQHFIFLIYLKVGIFNKKITTNSD